MTSSTKMPTASVVLLTYNQEHFVEEALLSLLNQDMDDLEIVVSDDCSVDATWGKIQAIADGYQGSKKLILSRNAENMGIVNNYCAAVNQSSGEVIFTAAGDDISAPERCSQCIQFWIDSGEKYDLVAADAFDMAYDGTVLGVKENSQLQSWTIEQWFDERPYFFGASHMVTRRLLELGPLSSALPYEDQCLVFRAMLMGGAARLPIPLVCHRRGGLTQTTQFKFGHRRSEIVRDMSRELIELKQFSLDAQWSGKQSMVQLDISKKMKYCQAVLDLFGRSVSLMELKNFWNSDALLLKDKYRYLRYYFFIQCWRLLMQCEMVFVLLNLNFDFL